MDTSPLRWWCQREDLLVARWLTYRSAGADRIGAVHDQHVFALPLGASLLGLLNDGVDMVDAARRAIDQPAEVAALSDVAVAPLITPPALIDSMCFFDHIRHCFPQWDARHEKWPFYWIGQPTTILGANDPVAMFAETEQFDYEVEIGAVIGRGGANLSPDEGEEAIAGYTIFCDWSGRDIQMERTVPLKGKDGATTLGPWFVTKDEFEPYRSGKGFDIETNASVNGRHISRGNWATVDWSFGDVVAYVSRGSRIVPGTVIGSGTVGWGCLLEFKLADPENFPGWLQSGDQVHVEAQLLGSLDQVITPPSPFPLLTSGF